MNASGSIYAIIPYHSNCYVKFIPLWNTKPWYGGDELRIILHDRLQDISYGDMFSDMLRNLLNY